MSCNTLNMPIFLSKLIKESVFPHLSGSPYTAHNFCKSRQNNLNGSLALVCLDCIQHHGRNRYPRFLILPLHTLIHAFVCPRVWEPLRLEERGGIGAGGGEEGEGGVEVRKGWVVRDFVCPADAAAAAAQRRHLVLKVHFARILFLQNKFQWFLILQLSIIGVG